ncbi:unnamed protein product [Moneuplotes crassus]|uniref:BZIP domain-containing protein n=1 Tax=Euplotes crassus TaxID=5936 RepID=A0AAD1UEN8_EUPCR|nr:unnamed protein product [Moneuplotes crassus]
MNIFDSELYLTDNCFGFPSEQWNNDLPSLRLGDFEIHDIPDASNDLESCARDTTQSGQKSIKKRENKKQRTEEENKERNRLRAKLTRKRKANFYKDLEERNNMLEQENQRLRKEIEEFKKKEYQWSLGMEFSPQAENKSFEEESLHSGNFIKNYLKREGPNGEKTKAAIKNAFKIILESCVTTELQPFLTCHENPLHLEWTELNKIPKMMKFHWNHYQKENKVSDFEKIFSHMKLKKLQHKRFLKLVQCRLQTLALKYESTIRNLMITFQNLSSNSIEFEEILLDCLKDEILTEPQLHTFIKESQTTGANHLWNSHINHLQTPSKPSFPPSEA